MRMLNLTVLGLVGAVLIVVGVAVSWQRTLIPAALDGTVRNIVTFEGNLRISKNVSRKEAREATLLISTGGPCRLFLRGVPLWCLSSRGRGARLV